MNKHYLTNEDFDYIYSKVPRLNIDLVIQSAGGVLLALRSIEPNNGCWHMPGGTVYKEEKINEAAIRIAKKETGLDISVIECLGYMEFPREKRGAIDVHTVSIVMKTELKSGEIRHDENAKELKWYKDIPDKMIPEHAEFLKTKKLVI